MTIVETTKITINRLLSPLCALMLLMAPLGCVSSQPKPKQETPGQSFTQAMDLVCHVDDHIAASDDDPLERDQRRSDFLQSRIKNPDVIYHRTLWRVQAAKQRAKIIRDLSFDAKLDACPYADSLDEDAF